MIKLSDRIRPNSEAAPWVVEKVKEMEEALKISFKALKESHECWPVWSGTSSTFKAHQKQLDALEKLSIFFRDEL